YNTFACDISNSGSKLSLCKNKTLILNLELMLQIEQHILTYIMHLRKLIDLNSSSHACSGILLSTSTKGYPLKACPEISCSVAESTSLPQSLTSSFSQKFSPDESSLNPVSINSDVLDSVSIRLSSSSLINLPLLSRDTCLCAAFLLLVEAY